MKSLQKAFDIAKPKVMIVVDAIVNKPPYSGIEMVVINKLWNGKIAVFRQSFTAKDTGYTLFKTEEDFWESIEIKQVYSFSPEAEKRPMIEESLTLFLV